MHLLSLFFSYQFWITNNLSFLLLAPPPFLLLAFSLPQSFPIFSHSVFFYFPAPGLLLSRCFPPFSRSMLSFFRIPRLFPLRSLFIRFSLLSLFPPLLSFLCPSSFPFPLPPSFLFLSISLLFVLLFPLFSHFLVCI